MDIPQYLYHKSNPKFREKILSEGLKPQKGDSYTLWFEDHFEKSKDEIEPLIFLYDASIREYDSTYDDDIYKIDTSKISKVLLEQDPTLSDYCYTYPITIKPEAFELIYKGSGNSL